MKTKTKKKVVKVFKKKTPVQIKKEEPVKFSSGKPIKWSSLTKAEQEYWRAVHLMGPAAGVWQNKFIASRTSGDYFVGHPFGNKPLEHLQESIRLDEEERQIKRMRDIRLREQVARLAASRSEPEKQTESKPVKSSKEEKPKQQKPGVIKTIIGYLEAASKKKPITREEIVKRLTKEFPDREVKAMSSTVSSQVPGALLVEKGIKVSGEKTRGFWIEKPGK